MSRHENGLCHEPSAPAVTCGVTDLLLDQGMRTTVPSTTAPRTTTSVRKAADGHKVTLVQCGYCRAFSPRTAPAIIRFSAAIDSPPSSVGGIVAKPMAEALG